MLTAPRSFSNKLRRGERFFGGIAGEARRVDLAEARGSLGSTYGAFDDFDVDKSPVCAEQVRSVSNDANSVWRTTLLAPCLLCGLECEWRP